MGDNLFIPGLKVSLGDLPSPSIPQDDFGDGLDAKGRPSVAKAPAAAGGFVPPSQGQSSTGSGEIVRIDRSQLADLDTFTFDRMGIPAAGVNNVAAGATQFQLVSLLFPNRVRGRILRFGWYTTAGGGDVDLMFGLYINNELYLPGGRFIGDQARATSQYDPSAGSIDFMAMCECNIAVPQGASAQILVTNLNGIVTYQAWGRLWGDHWSDDTVQVQSSRRAAEPPQGSFQQPPRRGRRQ